MLENCNIPILNKEKINHYETEYMIDELSGEGRMYCIDLYEGVQIIYNRFHCYDAPKTVIDNNSTKYIEINHCLRGKFECLYDQEYYAYLIEGDLSISRWSLKKSNELFTFGYYEGLEVLIDTDKSQNNEIFSEFNIDIKLISKKLTLNNDIYIMRVTQQIQHIFMEMYSVDDDVKVDYLKIKVLELLLFLSHTDFEMIQDKKRYYPKNQIETVKSIKNYLSKNLNIKPDFNKLAQEYNININTLRKIFKEIYGVPIYTWFKQYRIEYSIGLLKKTDMPIIEIANKIGYSNPSKYSAAFSKYVNMTPQQYRKSDIKMD
ncbi:AraC family transcriptional regulator [Intestinibacter bartlettii]|uniref:AraC family transcriptional regulator n=2 Tax=Intestinibacter bartlettii TaxID=261299 RepID=A0ABS6DZN8_9FIRM|nr:helix-turn-helix domain-containing protein [Intestinibacter bartlettii]MBU5337301.1 AraC family transcriptional regulator [Intestinibacter bartlettii]